MRVDVTELDSAGVADESDEPDADVLPELSAEDADVDAAVVVVDDELSPLLTPVVCEAVSQAARNSVAAKSAIRR